MNAVVAAVAVMLVLSLCRVHVVVALIIGALAAHLLALRTDGRWPRGAAPIVLAGVQGGDLDELKQRLAAPDSLIDLRHIADLKGVTVNGKDVRIGAGTPHISAAVWRRR